MFSYVFWKPLGGFKTQRCEHEERISDLDTRLCRSSVFMYVCWFSGSQQCWMSWNKTEILQMFGATSDNTNQNYTNINVSFLQVHEQQHCSCPSGVKGLRFICASFSSSWWHFDLLIQTLVFSFISMCDPIKGTKWALHWNECSVNRDSDVCDVITLLSTWIKPPACWHFPLCRFLFDLLLRHREAFKSSTNRVESAAGKAVWMERAMSAFPLHCSQSLAVKQPLSPVHTTTTTTARGDHWSALHTFAVAHGCVCRHVFMLAQC